MKRYSVIIEMPDEQGTWEGDGPLGIVSWFDRLIDRSPGSLTDDIHVTSARPIIPHALGCSWDEPEADVCDCGARQP